MLVVQQGSCLYSVHVLYIYLLDWTVASRWCILYHLSKSHYTIQTNIKLWYILRSWYTRYLTFLTNQKITYKKILLKKDLRGSHEPYDPATGVQALMSFVVVDDKAWKQLMSLQDLLEYRKKLRTLRVRMLDGTLKTLLVDDSQPVANLMVVICTKIGNCNSLQHYL